MISCTVGSVSANVKKWMIHVSEPKKNLVSQDQVMSHTSNWRLSNFSLASLSAYCITQFAAAQKKLYEFAFDTSYFADVSCVMRRPDTRSVFNNRQHVSLARNKVWKCLDVGGKAEWEGRRGMERKGDVNFALLQKFLRAPILVLRMMKIVFPDICLKWWSAIVYIYIYGVQRWY